MTARLDNTALAANPGVWPYLLVLVAALIGLSACTSADDEGQSSEAESSAQDDGGGSGIVVVDDCTDDEDRLCVGLVTGLATAADVGLQDAARQAVLEWGDDNDVTVTELDAESEDEYQDNTDLLIERGHGVIVLPAKQSASVVVESASANPDIQFVAVDQVGLPEAPNLAVLTFSNHEVGFLAGALAGLLTESGDVAQILGSSLVPPLADLRDGFQNGVSYTNSRVDVNAFFHPGDPETAFEDPSWGSATATQAMEDGADVIFATGGETGHGALVAAAEFDEEALCIGSDFDKWDVVVDSQPCLVSSVVKILDDAMADVLDSAADGDLRAGEVVGEVGFSDYHDFEDEIPAEIRQAADEIAERVRQGETSASRRR